MWGTEIDLRLIPESKVVRKYKGLTQNPVKLGFSNNNKYLIAYSKDNYLSVWNVDSAKQLLIEKMELPHQITIAKGSIVVKRHDKSTKHYKLKEVTAKKVKTKS